jgi:hypothetical protein
MFAAVDVELPSLASSRTTRFASGTARPTVRNVTTSSRHCFCWAAYFSPPDTPETITA